MSSQPTPAATHFLQQCHSLWPGIQTRESVWVVPLQTTTERFLLARCLVLRWSRTLFEHQGSRFWGVLYRVMSVLPAVSAHRTHSTALVLLHCGEHCPQTRKPGPFPFCLCGSTFTRKHCRSPGNRLRTIDLCFSNPVPPALLIFSPCSEPGPPLHH